MDNTLTTIFMNRLLNPNNDPIQEYLITQFYNESDPYETLIKQGLNRQLNPSNDLSVEYIIKKGENYGL